MGTPENVREAIRIKGLRVKDQHFEKVTLGADISADELKLYTAEWLKTARSVNDISKQMMEEDERKANAKKNQQAAADHAKSTGIKHDSEIKDSNQLEEAQVESTIKFQARKLEVQRQQVFNDKAIEMERSRERSDEAKLSEHDLKKHREIRKGAEKADLLKTHIQEEATQTYQTEVKVNDLFEVEPQLIATEGKTLNGRCAVR